MNKNRRLIIILVLVLVGGILTSVAWFSHGYLWSVREIRFKKLLNSLPEPPGWISATEHLNTDTYSPFGFREYEVSSSYEDIKDFFRAEIPRLDLQPLLEKEHDVTASTEPDRWLQSTSMLFSYEKSFCVEVFVLISTNEDGVPVDDRAKVHITIAEKAEKPACRQFE